MVNVPRYKKQVKHTQVRERPYITKYACVLSTVYIEFLIFIRSIRGFSTPRRARSSRVPGLSFGYDSRSLVAHDERRRWLRERLVASPGAAAGGEPVAPAGAAFHQSSGQLKIAGNRVGPSPWVRYHNIIHLSTWKVVVIMTAAYFILTREWRSPTTSLGDDCGLEMDSFLDAML